MPISPAIAETRANVQPAVLSAIREASDRTGVDFAYLMEKAAAESSFNPTAKARTSSATGLYQFIERTWFEMIDKHGAKHGFGEQAALLTTNARGHAQPVDAAARRELLALRDDPRASALMAAEYANDNKQYLEKRLGRETDSGDLYLAHFLGPEGARKFLAAQDSGGDAPAAAVLPAAARANRAIFYEGGRARSLDEVAARVMTRFADDGPAIERPVIPQRPELTVAANLPPPLPAPSYTIPSAVPRISLAGLLAMQHIERGSFG